MGRFHTFVGVDLGGGKGKHTAVAHLEAVDGGVRVIDYGTGKEGPWFDDRLLAYLRALAEGSALALDAPLTLPCCVRCQLPQCPGTATCEVPTIAWFRQRALLAPASRVKPAYTSYTQRACEVLLQEVEQMIPREALGQGTGPLTARAAYLVRALAPQFRRDENFIEVYPKATVAQLYSTRIAHRYKRSAQSPATRLQIFNSLHDLTFAPGAWREDAINNDHKFDAILCAYTAYLWAQGACVPPPDSTVAHDGWIWIPAKPPQASPMN